jgi:hypothetical protein
MAEGTSSSGSLVLEKELTCSVCVPQRPARIPVLILLPDLYRCHVPALDPARLPPYLLWFLLEGMVLMAGHFRCTSSPQDEPVYMPFMSCRSARHAAECDCHDAAGHVPHFESGARQKQCRERGDAQSLQAWGGRDTARGDRARLRGERG